MDQQSASAVAVAREQLAAELGCPHDALAVARVEEVEWNDSSLGCPEPGMMYMQVITPGYRIVLEHNGLQYIMHTDWGRRAVRCRERSDSKPTD